MMRRRTLLTGAAYIASLLPLHAWWHGKSTSKTYYVSPTGSDGNDGLSTSTPWQTLAKVSASTFSFGDKVLFQGGQTFTGALVLSSANWSATSPPTESRPVYFGSYGTGRATLAATGTTRAVKITNIGAITFDNLILTGNGTSANTAFEVYNNTTQTQYAGLTFSRLDVSGFATAFDIQATGTGATKGFTDVSISTCTLHSFANVAGGVGIFIQGNTTTSYAHHNFMIDNVTVTQYPGDGIDCWGINGVTVQNCVIHDGGGHTGSTTAFSTQYVNNGVIQSNEIYNQASATDGFDADGIDLDLGTSNTVVQYNYVHGNAGCGIALFQGGAGTIPWVNNTVRFNITQGNGVGTTNVPGEIAIGASGQIAVTGLAVINNVFYGTTTNSLLLSGPTNITGTIANNIFYTTQPTANIVTTASANMKLYGNDYFGSVKFRYNSVNYASYAAWRTASGMETLAAADVGHTSDPQLTTPGGGTAGDATAYKLRTGSPMVGVGLDVLAQFSIDPGARDFFNSPVPSDGLSVGADNASPLPAQSYVIVQRGVSQAVIQVVKPTADLVTLQVSGGGVAYANPDTNWDYWINGAQTLWYGGNLPQADVISRKLMDVTNGQWHMVWQVTPDNAAGELVTIIEVGAVGDTYTPKTLAQVQALAPQLFV